MRKTLSLIIVLTAVALFASVVLTGSAASGQPSKSKGGNIAGVYKAQCSKCHGDDGKGIESLEPPDFTDAKWQSSQTDKQLGDSIRDGKGVMPGYKDSLTAAKINGLVKYVRAFAAKSEKTEKK